MGMCTGWHTDLPRPGSQLGQGQEAGEVCGAKGSLAASLLPEIMHLQEAVPQTSSHGSSLELSSGKQVCQWRLQKESHS